MCIEGHGGPKCEKCDCGGNGSNARSAHGACNPSPSSKAMCQCYFPYVGDHCAQCGCFNGGICTNSSGGSLFYGCICQGNFDAESSCLDCAAGYYKVTGTNPRHNDKCLECPGGKDNPCSKNGICTADGTCRCLNGWDGPFCGSRKTEAFIIPENKFICGLQFLLLMNFTPNFFSNLFKIFLLKIKNFPVNGIEIEIFFLLI